MTVQSDGDSAFACIAEIAGRSFDSMTVAMEVIFAAVTRYLHCRSSLIARVAAGGSQVHIIAAYDNDTGAGAQGVAFTPAAAEVAFWRGERVTDEVMLITAPCSGYAVGVPICLADGTQWGQLVSLGDTPMRLTVTQVYVLQVMAQRLADEFVRHSHHEDITVMNSDFVSIVSHEFRTALMSILGFSQMLRDEDNTLAEIHEFAADIFNDATRINRMITDMLDLDRLESGRMELALAEIDLNGILRDIIARFMVTTSKHTLSLQIDPRLPAVIADGDKAIQIISNLLSNAIKYSPQGGEIIVGSVSEHGFAHIWVRDQGIGIPTDALERIFERYARVEARTSRYIQGTGLGLPIVRQLAQMHGGHAWAESTSGIGSTFHVTLPVAQAQPLSA